MFEIRYDDKRLKQLERTLKGIPRALPKVMSRALNRTTEKARTDLSRFGAKRFGWRKKDVMRYITIRHASYKNWRSNLSFPKRKISVIHLKAKEKSGVSYKDPISGSRRTESSAFIATGKKKGRQVWRRSVHAIGRRKYISWAGRRMEALYMMKGPSLFGLLMEHARAETERIHRESMQRLQKNIQDQVRLILRRRAG